jgi:hypothetical protein
MQMREPAKPLLFSFTLHNMPYITMCENDAFLSQGSGHRQGRSARGRPLLIHLIRIGSTEYCPQLSWLLSIAQAYSNTTPDSDRERWEPLAPAEVRREREHGGTGGWPMHS